MPDLSPLFVCGTARSGTTLMLQMLEGHPALAVVPWETHGFLRLLTTLPSRLIARAADVGGWSNLPAVLAALPLRAVAFRPSDSLRRELHQWLSELPDVDGDNQAAVARIMRAARSPEQYWHTLLEVLEARGVLTTAGRRYWVEKTPQNERFVALSERLFGGRARYLHMVRDPRDVIASWAQRIQPRGAPRTTGIVNWTVTWSRSIECCRQHLQAVEGRYALARYEDLVRHPKEMMKKICAFLDIPSSDRLLRPTRLGRPAGVNTSYQYAPEHGAVLRSHIGRYPEVLQPKERELIERCVGAQMAALGYSAPLKGSSTIRQIVAGLARHPKAALKALHLNHIQKRYEGLQLPVLRC